MSTKDNDPAQDPHKLGPLVDDPAVHADGVTAAAKPAADNGGDDHDAAASAATASDALRAGDTVHTAAAADHAEEAPAAAAEDVASAPTVEQEAPGQLPGEVLAARRIEMRLSIEELSARVKLAPRQLLALEANDFGSLPGMATTRGFIRSCAKALGLDPEPLLIMLANEPNPALGPMVMRRPLPQPGFNGRRYAPATSHRRSANKLSGLAAVVLIFVGMLAYVAWRNDWLSLPTIDLSAARDAMMPTAIVHPESRAASDVSDDAATHLPPVAEDLSSKATAKPPAASKAGAPATSADVEPHAAAAAASVATAEPASTAASKALAANIDPARTLELKLREDAWVEVLTQNGERKLLSRLMKAGSTERVEVNEPVILIVGNAAGVDVTLRGLPVSLKAGTRDNVAKVNLK